MGDTGEVNYIEIKLDKGIFSHDPEKVKYTAVENVSDVRLLKISIDMDK
ncbi:hypothetical protein ALNOE001_21850 [Candidatus Methanobinarius endosymbioticus]|uniref:Uncharacterized protein n=1 Tax=Candidatus Methanobinarius endosymbioticus TaxID=2006182 RepID=A0A366M8R3_9EURY|nr:hypothetical protein ALNOE001_21850 [Candidatus Methanobinarius endosymbioticus]